MCVRVSMHALMSVCLNVCVCASVRAFVSVCVYVLCGGEGGGE